ncbi:hypothetical protein B0H17DRAFT_1177004 [Mycena rosella]|uniref:Uncharacterized protein n=1 Tax=Mycena rosella TaxID=1033263 RepID=A0AAD7GPN6_MYCRO|nr:hypothetical protein B0H17DRAFT_1177004 [Mycena rosella]
MSSCAKQIYHYSKTVAWDSAVVQDEGVSWALGPSSRVYIITADISRRAAHGTRAPTLRLVSGTSKGRLVHWHPVLDPLGLLDVMWRKQAFTLRLATRAYAFEKASQFLLRAQNGHLYAYRSPRRYSRKNRRPTIDAGARAPSPTVVGCAPGHARRNTHEFAAVVHVRLMVVTRVATAPACGGGAELTCTRWPLALGWTPRNVVARTRFKKLSFSKAFRQASVFYDAYQLRKDAPSCHEESPPQPSGCIAFWLKMFTDYLRSSAAEGVQGM